MKPLIVDEAGNGLYETAIGRAWVDFTSPEERWCMSQDGPTWEDYMLEQEIEYARELELERLGVWWRDSDPWGREVPSGDMQEVESR